MSVKSVVTFKAGHFKFSDKYDAGALESRFVEARVLKETVADLPILPRIAAKLDKETIRKSIFSTAALEGNPLSEDEVGRLLEQDDLTAAKQRADMEVKNLQQAYPLIRQLSAPDKPLLITEDMVRDLHRTITQGIDHDINTPGSYRDQQVRVGNKDHGGVYVPPKILPDIQKLMAEFIPWINHEDLLGEPPPVRAALAHYHLALIHPFGDGNGRTARLIEAAVLYSQGVRFVPEMMSNYYYDHPDDYYWAFSLARKNKAHDLTAFVEFVQKAFIEGLYALKEKISHYIRVLTLSEHYWLLRETRDISKRQYELLRLLIGREEPFTLNDLFKTTPFLLLYSEVSTRTARRDLAKLTAMNLLIKGEDGSHALNPMALDNR